MKHRFISIILWLAYMVPLTWTTIMLFHLGYYWAAAIGLALILFEVKGE